ncbi:MAG: hypothetical protein HeimC2_17920 [Candidatus Heimdallarchaeota archaeon LC_2]|nr:MAG: hypothetical protein HeimC2_17920 [Candidatus Heimdallarchaeota archaeon LC_2]
MRNLGFFGSQFILIIGLLIGVIFNKHYNSIILLQFLFVLLTFIYLIIPFFYLSIYLTGNKPTVNETFVNENQGLKKICFENILLESFVNWFIFTIIYSVISLLLIGRFSFEVYIFIHGIFLVSVSYYTRKTFYFNFNQIIYNRKLLIFSVSFGIFCLISVISLEVIPPGDGWIHNLIIIDIISSNGQVENLNLAYGAEFHIIYYILYQITGNEVESILMFSAFLNLFLIIGIYLFIDAVSDRSQSKYDQGIFLSITILIFGYLSGFGWLMAIILNEILNETLSITALSTDARTFYSPGFFNFIFFYPKNIGLILGLYLSTKLFDQKESYLFDKKFVNIFVILGIQFATHSPTFFVFSIPIFAYKLLNTSDIRQKLMLVLIILNSILVFLITDLAFGSGVSNSTQFDSILIAFRKAFTDNYLLQIISFVIIIFFTLKINTSYFLNRETPNFKILNFMLTGFLGVNLLFTTYKLIFSENSILNLSLSFYYYFNTYILVQFIFFYTLIILHSDIKFNLNFIIGFLYILFSIYLLSSINLLIIIPRFIEISLVLLLPVLHRFLRAMYFKRSQMKSRVLLIYLILIIISSSFLVQITFDYSNEFDKVKYYDETWGYINKNYDIDNINIVDPLLSSYFSAKGWLGTTISDYKFRILIGTVSWNIMFNILSSLDFTSNRLFLVPNYLISEGGLFPNLLREMDESYKNNRFTLFESNFFDNKTGFDYPLILGDFEPSSTLYTHIGNSPYNPLFINQEILLGMQNEIDSMIFIGPINQILFQKLQIKNEYIVTDYDNFQNIASSIFNKPINGIFSDINMSENNTFCSSNTFKENTNLEFSYFGNLSTFDLSHIPVACKISNGVASISFVNHFMRILNEELYNEIDRAMFFSIVFDQIFRYSNLKSNGGLSSYTTYLSDFLNDLELKENLRQSFPSFKVFDQFSMNGDIRLTNFGNSGSLWIKYPKNGTHNLINSSIINLEEIQLKSFLSKSDVVTLTGVVNDDEVIFILWNYNIELNGTMILYNRDWKEYDFTTAEWDQISNVTEEITNVFEDPIRIKIYSSLPYAAKITDHFNSKLSNDKLLITENVEYVKSFLLLIPLFTIFWIISIDLKFIERRNAI